MMPEIYPTKRAAIDAAYQYLLAMEPSCKRIRLTCDAQPDTRLAFTDDGSILGPFPYVFVYWESKDDNVPDCWEEFLYEPKNTSI